ncbi:MAG: NfeD family protein [Christensenellales bacterium]|jgi:membrane-bound ClpP family serine protease
MQVLADAAALNVIGYICLAAGFALVTVEMYIPGFGLPGISGIILLVLGVAFKASNWMEAVVITAIVLMLLCVVLSFSIRSASKGRLAKSQLVLREAPEHVESSDIQAFVGKNGVAKTVLRPAGIGEFDGVRLDVVTDGEFIRAGDAIVVSRVEGNRIVVEKTEDNQ